MCTSGIPTTEHPAPLLDPATVDAIRPGDHVTLTRYWPAGYDGPSARRIVLHLTVASLVRTGRAGEPRGPQWSFLATDLDPQRAGYWAIGRELSGMVTTLAPRDA